VRRMASLIAGLGGTLILAFLLALHAMAGEEEDSDDTLKTRHGLLYVLKREAPDVGGVWELKLKGRVLVRSEGIELALWKCPLPPCPRALFAGDDGREYAIVEKVSGGIACPFKFLVLELQGGDKTRVSEEFGSCLEPSGTRLVGDALVLEMPAYIPHPDLLTPREVRRRERTTEVYTYRNGDVR
jgi:hypothetical protein